jgi:hypothetical protein
MANVIKMLLSLRFFTISFKQLNDVYVKIYETTHLIMFKLKTDIHVNFANVLWVAFLLPTGSLSLVKFLKKNLFFKVHIQ